MNSTKLKEYIGLLGGLLSAILSFLTVIGISYDWFTLESIDAFTTILISAIPFVLIVYGVYKNSYIITKKAKKQEKHLKELGLK